MIFDWFKRRNSQKISGVEIRIYEVDCEQTATEFFRLQIENENLKQQLRQCENDFQLKVSLESRVKNSNLIKENLALRQENYKLKRQIET